MDWRYKLGVGFGTLLVVSMLCILVIVASEYFLRAPEEPMPDDVPYQNAELPGEMRISDLLSRMTLEEKIGQMALVEKNSVYDGDVAAYGLGGILSGAGAKPDDNTPSGWNTMTTGFTTESRSSRLGIPILYGVDANHGHGNVPGATIFPHAIGLGATRDPGLVEAVAAATAREVRATGINWIYGPTLDLPGDIRWGRVYEAFTDDPVLAGELGSAFVRGVQGVGTLLFVLATPKHFAGAGGMRWDTSSNPDFHIDQGTTPVDEDMLRSTYVPPFEKAIESGALGIMAGLNSWGDEKVSASSYLITTVLKGEMGFSGFVVSDWYGVYEISENDYDSAVQAINAGVDMVMLPFDYTRFIRNVSRAVKSGDIAEARIDDAVRRIVRAKFALGLFEPREVLSLEIVGSEAHHALARDAVAQSLVLLKNDDDLLPLPKNVRKIRVAGSAADNVGMQSGAWTIEWQGIDGNWLPGGTSILAGIRAQAASSLVEYEKDGVFMDKDIADIGIAVVGEKPYAEGWGDNEEPRVSDEDNAAIERLRTSSRSLVVVIISGRPLIVTDQIAGWDALVAAWLPGSEGAGVADVLFGGAPFGGVLPLPWPRSTLQLPMIDGFGSDGTSPLFPRYFGLTTEVR